MSAAAWVPEDADISDLREAAPACRGCELWEPATQVVFSAGNPRAPLMLVGEQPGGPWLEAEVDAVNPRLVVCLGATAAKALLSSGFRVSQQRGQVLDSETAVGRRQVLATIHPSAVLRTQPEEREAAYTGLVDDLKVAAEAIA